MDTLSNILQLVANLGFPVVMCFLIFRQNSDLSAKFETLVENTTRCMTETTNAVNNLSRVITDLSEEVHDGNRK